jgi:hypothetical protein
MCGFFVSTDVYMMPMSFPPGWIKISGKWSGRQTEAPEATVDICSWTCVERYAVSKFEMKPTFDPDKATSRVER